MNKFFSVLLFFCFVQTAYAQLGPVSNSYNNNRTVYTDTSREFTAWKAIIDKDTTDYTKDKSHSWLHRKLFNEHLIQFNEEGYNVYIDFMPGFVAGRDVKNKKTIWLNTRGVRLQANIGKDFYFESDFYENQTVLPQYLDNYANVHRVIPGQGEPKFNDNNLDYSNSSALLYYKPSKYVDFTLGYGKNFIGDGYRSVILSDAAFNYPYLKVAGTLGRVQYSVMWAQFIDQNTPRWTSYNTGYPKKWGVFHYLDWSINKKWSVGLFENIMWQDADSTGKRGFDYSYLNPIVILRPVEFANGSPDNAQIGLTTKFKPNNKWVLYGQLLLDEFKLKEMKSENKWWANKYAVQLGVRNYDMFKVKNLDGLFEFNTARPYTYSHHSSLQNYGHYNEALAHPLGANFYEWVGFLSYRYKRWFTELELMYSKYGLDGPGDDYGKDIYKSYECRNKEYGNYTGQGVATNLYFSNVKMAYVLNPKYNLRLETNITYRNETNDLQSQKGFIFNIGLRSSFRRFYYDF